MCFETGMGEELPETHCSPPAFLLRGAAGRESSMIGNGLDKTRLSLRVTESI